MTYTISRFKLLSLLDGLNGRFFGVTFRKRNGELRTMNARKGVRKFAKGGAKKIGLPWQPYITVWSRNDNGYRTVNLATVQEITANGNTYRVQW